MLFQLWRQCKKWLLLTTTKKSICSSLVDFTKPVYTNQLMRKRCGKIFIHGVRLNISWKTFHKMLMVVHLSYLHEKHLLMKVFFGKQQTNANFLLGLMLANYTSTGCHKQCQPLIIRIPNSFQRRVDWCFDKTRPLVLKKKGRVLVSTPKTRMWSWNLQHCPQPDETELFECWRTLFSM